MHVWGKTLYNNRREIDKFRTQFIHVNLYIIPVNWILEYTNQILYKWNFTWQINKKKVEYTFQKRNKVSAELTTITFC